MEFNKTMNDYFSGHPGNDGEVLCENILSQDSSTAMLLPQVYKAEIYCVNCF